MKYKLKGGSEVEVLKTLPKGWKETKGAMTAPLGTVMVDNGGSLFGEGGKRRKFALVVTDEKLFNERNYPIADKVFTDIEEAKAYAVKIAAQAPHGRTAMALIPKENYTRKPRKKSIQAPAPKSPKSAPKPAEEKVMAGKKKTAEVYEKGTVGYEIMNGPIEARECSLRSLSKEADRQKMLNELAQKANKTKDPVERRSIASTLKRFGYQEKQAKPTERETIKEEKYGRKKDSLLDGHYGPVSEKQEKAKRPNPFAGADDIYVTKNKIAVTKTKKTSAKRGYTRTTQTKYYAQNDSNLKQLKAAQGDTVRKGRKGNNYKRI